MPAHPDPPHRHGVARYRVIADELARRIRAGEYPGSEPMPSVLALAGEFGVARLTIDRAFDVLEGEHRLVSRRSRRWVAHGPTPAQDIGGMRSFAQWARATGATPSGRFVRRAGGRASALEARRLGVGAGEPVLRTRRVRALDGRIVMLERTTFPIWLASTLLALPDDAPSIAEAVCADHGVELGRTENLVSAVAAGALDARLLGVRPGSPLLRVVRTAHFLDGRVFEHSDDRYAADAVEFSFVTSAPGR